MQSEDNRTEKRLREIEARLLKLEQSEQRRAEAGLEFLRKMATAEPAANLTPHIAPMAAAIAKTQRDLVKLERKNKYRKPRRKT
jgi:hypothetical protein